MGSFQSKTPDTSEIYERVGHKLDECIFEINKNVCLKIILETQEILSTRIASGKMDQDEVFHARIQLKMLEQVFSASCKFIPKLTIADDGKAYTEDGKRYHHKGCDFYAGVFFAQQIAAIPVVAKYNPDKFDEFCGTSMMSVLVAKNFPKEDDE